MNFNLTNITATQAAVLAVLATVVASLMSASSAIAVAWVNSRTALAQTRVNTRREYRQKFFEPFMTRVDERVVNFSIATELLTHIEQIEGEYAKLQEKENTRTMARFATQADAKPSEEVILDSFARQDAKLSKAIDSFHAAENGVRSGFLELDKIYRRNNRLPSDIQSLIAIAKRNLDTFVHSAIDLRVAVEEFVFG